MCGRNIKRLLLLLLLPLLLALSPGICWAAGETLTMTGEEAQQFQDSFEMKLQIISDLQLKMRNSNELITSLEKRLQQSNQRAQNLELNSKQAKEMQLQQQKIIEELKSDYKKQEALLQQTLTAFAKYVKDNKPKRNSFGFYGDTRMTKGLYYKHDRLLLMAGWGSKGELVAGAGVEILAW